MKKRTTFWLSSFVFSFVIFIFVALFKYPVMKKHLPTQCLLALLVILVMGMGKIWASDTKEDYTNSYFTIESLADDNDILMSIPPGITSAELTSVSYSTDGTNWTTIEIDDTDQSFTVVLGQNEKLYFKGGGKTICHLRLSLVLPFLWLKGFYGLRQHHEFALWRRFRFSN